MHVSGCRAVLLSAVIGLSLGYGQLAQAVETKTENTGSEGAKQNALKPKGKAGPMMLLASGGTANYIILLPARPTAVEEKAARELAFNLHQMSGAVFLIKKENGAGNVNFRQISLGRTKLARAAGLMSGSGPGAEGYRIDSRGQTLFLLGGSGRGIVNAVMALLEEDLGCRWYAIGTSDLPHLPALSLRPVLRTYTPPLEIRDPFYQDAFDVDWSLHNRTNGILVAIPPEWGGSTRYAFNQIVHTYERDMPAGEYFAAHPEYFALVDGKRQPTQLCVTNADMQRIMIEKFNSYLDKNPNITLIGLSPNDGGGFCDCPNCRAIDKLQGTRMGSLLQFVNTVADAVAVKHPNVKITTNAYTQTVVPPKTIRPRKNVIIELCTDTHAWRYGLLPVTETDTFRKALADWKKTGAEVHIWDYTMNYVHYLVPMPFLPVVGQNIRFYADNGVKGVMLQGKENSAGAADARLQCWVWAKQLWDPTRDTQPLVRDFTFGYYKESAEPMWEYQQLLWGIWKKYHDQPHSVDTPENRNPIIAFEPASYRPDGPLLSPGFVSRSTALLKQAEQLAKNPETLKRVQLAKLPILYVTLAQALGYTEEFRGYKMGSWIESGDQSQRARYKDALAEFRRIVNDQHVSSFSEMNGSLLARWEELLDREPVESVATGHDSGLSSAAMSVLTTELKKTPAGSFPLSNNWKFRTDPAVTGLLEKWYAPGYADEAWADLRSGSGGGWDDQGFPEYRGYGWYRQSLTIPENLTAHGSLYLLFESVDEEAAVFVNGKKAFEHSMRSSGLNPGVIEKTPFAFDIKPYLKEGVNCIAVRVYNRRGIGGITGAVSLIPHK